MTNNDDNVLWLALIRWAFSFLITLIIAVLLYNIADRCGPVRPQIKMEYSWPSGTK